jgi:membrane-associated phospholipid phosphatase
MVAAPALKTASVRGIASVLCAAAALTTTVASSAGAQSSSTDTTHAIVSREQARPDSSPPWVTKRELLGAGISVLATIAVAPLDKPVAGELQAAEWQKDEPLHSASQMLAFAGGPGPFVLGAGLFTVGELGRMPVLSSAGVHITASVLLAAALTGLGKGIAGRALPGVKTSEAFQWGRGFHSGNGPFVSFPSGHTAAAFAAASALTGEAAAWRPGSERYVGPVAYLTASAVAMARLYQHVHWVSDLPLAAVIGTWSGLSVESHVHRSQHRSPILRIAESATIQRTPSGGTIVGWSLPFVGPDW